MTILIGPSEPLPRGKEILHLGKFYFPDSGGIEDVTACAAKGAVKNGYSVTVACFAKKMNSGLQEIEGVKVVRCPTDATLASQPLGLKYLIVCYQLLRRADVIHLHFPNMLAAFVTLLKKNQTRLIVHWHSDIVDKGILGKISRPFEWAILKKADVIVTTSLAYGKASKSLSTFFEKIKVVPCGAKDPFRSEQRLDDTELSIDLLKKIQGRRIILSVGRLVPYKGFDVLIRAVKYMPDDVLVVIVGNGPLRKRLECFSHNSGMDGKVYFAGWQPDDVLDALYRISSLFCLPSISRAEAFGLVIIQAMSRGLPVVASDILGSGVPWVNMHDVSGLNFTVGNEFQLALSCNRILGSNELRKRYSIGARNRYLTTFTEDRFVNEIVKIYNHLNFQTKSQN
jgi:glycosyltransferase involved in cell wall biosynthesis